jgi:hypothetical protein
MAWNYTIEKLTKPDFDALVKKPDEPLIKGPHKLTTFNIASGRFSDFKDAKSAKLFESRFVNGTFVTPQHELIIYGNNYVGYVRQSDKTIGQYNIYIAEPLIADAGLVQAVKEQVNKQFTGSISTIRDILVTKLFDKL